MITRLTFLALASLILLFLATMHALAEHNDAPNFFLLLFLVSLAVIAYTLWSDAEFDIAGHFLFVYRPFFQRQTKYDLSQLRQWEEVGYNIRGQRRRNLLLVFDQQQTVEISNKDHKENYETVYNHLKKEFPEIEKFNMTALQEIKFKSVHRFLTTDFYSSGNRYSLTNEEKNELFSIDIFKMKLEGADRDHIAERLLEIKTKGLGEHETIGRCRQIADRVIEM